MRLQVIFREPVYTLPSIYRNVASYDEIVVLKGYRDGTIINAFRKVTE